MKKLLLAGVALAGLGIAGAASAADLPRRTEPVAPIMPPAIPIFTWTGFYVGVQAGYAWGGNGRDFGTLTAVDLDGEGITDVDSGAFGYDDGNDGFTALDLSTEPESFPVHRMLDEWRHHGRLY